MQNETRLSTKSIAMPAVALVIALAMAVAVVLATGFAGRAYAERLTTQNITYLPDVTPEMANPAYWYSKQKDPDAVQADRAIIDELNQAGIDAENTMLQPLKADYVREYFYNAEQQTTLKAGARAEMEEYLNQEEKVYDEDGNIIDEAYIEQILANYPEGGLAPSIQSGYAIVTTHTTMRAYPTDKAFMYTKGDYDDDNLYLSMLRVNEPLIVRSVSADGNFLLCISSCMQASWVPTADVAICKDKKEWLDAWDIEEGHELVVTGYKVRTEQSRVTPNTANRMLYMGTVLESIDWDDARKLVGTRSVYDNHVCYLPVRKADGTYSKEVALIAESAQVSEGFLPLTKANVAKVAFNSLGQMYGWGGMLEANDCSGYVRDVYKCFGLELARNTTWQMNLPVRKYDLRGLDDAHKAAAIAQMPLGTVLFWGGHEMIYLGQENGKLYVISSLGAIGDIFGEEQIVTQVKGVVINTLDMVRSDRTTWLQKLTTANIPYIPADAEGPGLSDIAFYEGSVTWPAESYTYQGKVIAPDVQVKGLNKGEDYQVAFKGNDGVGTATVTVSGKGAYTGKLSRTFSIVAPSKPKTTSMKDATVTVQDQVYTGAALAPAPLVRMGRTVLQEGTDYVVSYKGNMQAGTATVTVTGKGAYSGSTSATFEILPASLAKAQVTVSDQTYTGKPLEPKPVVKLGSATLAQGRDFSVSYADNKAVGTAVVTVKGAGNYADANFSTFKIKKASQVIKAKKSVKKKVSASAQTGALAKTKTVNLKKLAKVSAKTPVKYKKANKAGGKMISVSKTTGKVKLKKGLKAGTYKVKVKLTASANASYKAAKSKTVKLKVVVKG